MPSKAAHSYFIWLLKETEIFSLHKSQSYILEVPEVMVLTKPTPNVAKSSLTKSFVGTYLSELRIFGVYLSLNFQFLSLG